jgi:antitoxin PrlF
MSSATVTSKGQLTIPADIRDEFHIEPGHKLLFYRAFDGSLGVRVLQPVPDFGFGMFRYLSDPATSAELDQEINEGVADNVEPSPGKSTELAA